MRLDRLAFLMMLVLAGCAAQAAPASTEPSASPPSADQTVAPAVTPSPVALASSTPAATSRPSTAATPLSAVNGKIAFVRYDTKADMGAAFTIDPDGSREAKIGSGDVACSSMSPDGSTLLCSTWFERTGARPATAGLDGSHFRVLDAYPARKMSLGCTDWLAAGTRLLCASDWDRNANKADFGLYTVRASDGGDLKRVTAPPAGCVDSDVTLSPDRTHVAFDRICGTDEHGILYDVKPDGSELVQLSPSDLFISDPFGSAAWSPDGSRVAFGALVPAADSTALYVVNADGTGVRQIVSTDVGAVSTRWSPDGQSIAFTSRYRSHPQVWRVRPDGSGLEQLTDGADGSNSVAPAWSPDGARLVFSKDEDDKLGQDGIGRWSLWTMNADGTGRTRLTDLPGEGQAVWLPAPIR